MNGLTQSEQEQLLQTIEMFEVITQSQPQDYQSLEILKEAYSKLGREKDAIGTAKRIAEAYMQLGQLSSAILEYETILQQHPDDPDVKKALADIENKAADMTAAPPPAEADLSSKATGPRADARGAQVVEDGREMMFKLFVDTKHITAGDFEANWITPSLNSSPGKVFDPFLQSLQDKGLFIFDKSLKILTEKSGCGYMPLERYDVDAELAKKFPKDTCQRWCVLPFDKMSKSLMVATANPFNKQAHKEMSEALGSKELRDLKLTRIIWYVSPPPDLIKVLKKIFR